MIRETVTVYNRADGTEDRYGDPADSFEADGTDVQAWVQPQTASEDIIDRDVRLSYFKMLFPPDTDIDADSEVEWNDLRMRVNGKPQQFHNHHGLHHLEIIAELVEGVDGT